MALALGLAAAGAGPVEAGPQQAFGLLAYRTVRDQPANPGDTTVRLDLTVVARSDHDPAVLGYAAVHLTRGRVERIQLAGAAAAGSANTPRVVAAGQRVEVPCPSGTCLGVADPAKAEIRLTLYSQRPRGVNAVFFVGRGDALDYEVSALDGWAVKRVPLSSRVVLSADGAAAGAWAAFAGVESMGSPSAPGAKSGSVAVANLPCGRRVASATPPAGRGAGTVTLSGGVREYTRSCVPNDPYTQTPVALHSWAHGATTWRVHGSAAGETSGEHLVRLLVIDLPRTLPVPRTWRAWGWS